MSFNDALAQSAVRRSSNICALSKWADTLEKADREQFEVAVADLTIPHSDIFRAMRAMGFTLGLSTVGRHRNGVCTCDVQ